MLQIRTGQARALEQCALRAFEDDMVVHLQMFSPHLARSCGEAALRQTIRMGVVHARHLGFTNRGPVRFYIESMVMFGSEFDTDPQTCWAAAVLADPSLCNQMARSEALYASAMEWRAEVWGADDKYADQALRETIHLWPDRVPPPDAPFGQEMLSRLRVIHPQKVRRVGDSDMLSLIAAGQSRAERLGLAPERGAALCVIAMFGLGHAFDRDPLRPWVAATLGDPALADPRARLERLESRTLTYLRDAIANLDAARA